jgi:hypothetical protein
MYQERGCSAAEGHQYRVYSDWRPKPVVVSLVGRPARRRLRTSEQRERLALAHPKLVQGLRPIMIKVVSSGSLLHKDNMTYPLLSIIILS